MPCGGAAEGRGLGGRRAFLNTRSLPLPPSLLQNIANVNPRGGGIPWTPCAHPQPPSSRTLWNHCVTNDTSSTASGMEAARLRQVSARPGSVILIPWFIGSFGRNSAFASSVCWDAMGQPPLHHVRVLVSCGRRGGSESCKHGME